MEQRSHWKLTKRLLIAGLVAATLFLSGCSTNNQTQGTASSGSSVNGPNGANGKGCTKVGVLMPETTSSVRWDEYDGPLLKQQIKAVIPNAQIDYTNAQANSDLQQTQAEQDLQKGDCILVVAAHDSVAAAKIVTEAKAQNVPVIAYDRFIQSSETTAYVSFDGAAVGRQQAQYIVDHYEKYAKDGSVNLVMISGTQTDANALLFSKGAHSVLDPLFAKKTFNFLDEIFTPNWSGPVAQAEMSTQLNNTDQGIQIAYVGNDVMADGVITAIHKAGLPAGSILVTGQDATPTAIHNILAGTQNMTVYKPSSKEAEATGKIVKALYDGTDIKTATNGVTSNTAEGDSVPALLVQPIMVDIDNIKSTVIQDGYIKASDVCNGIPKGTGGVC